MSIQPQPPKTPTVYDVNAEPIDASTTDLQVPDPLTFRDTPPPLPTPTVLTEADLKASSMLSDINATKAHILQQVKKDIELAGYTDMKELRDATDIILKIEASLEQGTEGVLESLLNEYDFTIEDE